MAGVSTVSNAGTGNVIVHEAWEFPSLQTQKAQKTMMVTPRNLLVMAVFSLAAGCSVADTGTAEDWAGFTETGQASFYADALQNRKTASGDLYKHEHLTAAHKRLPLGSVVKVTNTDNGKSVEVKINDRGPFVEDRIIDLSKSAFSRIGKTSLGVISVKIEVLNTP